MNEECIIGAGITGITLARQVRDPIILDKARGIGGRLAARRLGGHYINHGPIEFQKLSGDELIRDPHAWIKSEAEGLDIRYSWEVSHFEVLPKKIVVHSKDGQKIDCRKLFLTTPAQQAQAILERSGLQANFLKLVSYSSCIQFMFLASNKIGIKELEKLFVLKHAKSISDDTVLKLYELKSKYLNQFLDQDKEEIKKFCLSKIDGPVIDSHAHKWRYAEVTGAIAPQFQSSFLDKNIFLAGDYFGLNGIQSSLGSVRYVLNFLKT